MLFLLQIYGLVIVAAAIPVLALYLTALLSLHVIRSGHSFIRGVGRVLATHTALWKHEISRSKLHANRRA
jgi:hypothetical protein